MSLNFRYIENLNTQLRSLLTISQVVKEVGLGKTNDEIVISKLIKWSGFLEQENPDYKLLKGTIANSKNKKLIIKKYIDLSAKMGLINSFNSVLYNTDIGKILYTLSASRNPNNTYLTQPLKKFFYNLLIKNDADLIILALQILNDAEQECSQKELQSVFKDYYLKRLDVKSRMATGNVRNELYERFKVVKMDWKKAHVYAEHLLIPRLEWLSQLSLIDKVYTSNKTKFKLSAKGNRFLQNLKHYKDPDIYDIDEHWIEDSCQKSFGHDKSLKEKWEELSLLKQQSLLAKHLLSVFEILAKGNAQRVPIFPALLFSVIMIYEEIQITVEFIDLKNLLLTEFKHKNKTFLIREAARSNEGYILIKY